MAFARRSRRAQLVDRSLDVCCDGVEVADDSLVGEAGSDILRGGKGKDAFWTSNDSSIDSIFGGSGKDFFDADSFDSVTQ